MCLVGLYGDVSFRAWPVVGIIPFHPRDKQVAVKPVEGYVCFRPRLVFVFSSPSVETAIPGCPGMRCEVILGQLE